MELKNLKFIDLFAGIGGFHQAMTSFGAKCVFASEWDVHAAQTYEVNYDLKPFGDITLIDEKDIPQHDILCGGFPCQAFSVSGKQKGFEDSRGTLFFDVARIVKFHKPRLVLLENVRNFERHDDGNTLRVVLKTLDELGYAVEYKVLNASSFGLPHNRERIFFVCFRKDIFRGKFRFPKPSTKKVCLLEFLEEEPDAKIVNRPDTFIKKPYSPSKDLFGKIDLPNKPIQIGIVNKGGQGERIYDPHGHAITLSAYGGGVGSKTGLYKVGNVIRKLSTRECARILGFSDDFKIVSSQGQAYKQFGNSVAINVLKAIFKRIIDTPTIDKNSSSQGDNTMNKKQLLGSLTAKGGFENEDDIVTKFNNYKVDSQAQDWLRRMGYNHKTIQNLSAVKIPSRINAEKAMKLGATADKVDETIKYKKADVQVSIVIGDVVCHENISLKKANIKANFNQIDKRSVDTYQSMWNFSDSIATTLKKFTGVIMPTPTQAQSLKAPHRWYLNELPKNEVEELLSFFRDNKILISNDILRGRGALAAEWFLVTKKNTEDNTLDWVLRNISEVMNFYSQGNIELSALGGLNLCKLRAQRKSGTPDPTSLQFKFPPLALFDS